MAVIGACITPAIIAAIPTSTKFCSGTDAPHRLKQRASTNPAIAPQNSVGPKVPPLPPPALVAVIAITLLKNTRAKNAATPQPERVINESTELPSTSISLPFRRSPSTPYPSP